MPRLRFARLVVGLLGALALCLASVVSAVAAPPPQAAAERYIVVLHDRVVDSDAAATELGRRHGGHVGFVYQHALKGFSIELPARAAAALARDPRVAYVERDQEVSAFGEVPTGVDRIEVDKKLALAGTGRTVDVDIAIIDSGIASHPDLNVYRATDCTGGGPFSRRCRDGSAPDGNGHGTHVAGTAAAKDDGSGVVGVAPGARLWAVRVLGNSGSGYISWIVAGVDWVTAHADSIEVANMSLGCECVSSALASALTRSTDAGVVYVVAAGNSGKDASTFSPANHSRVIAVSAIADFDGKAGAAAAPTCRGDAGTDDTFATFSNYGPVVALAAPGVCVTSTWLNGGYNTISGTSMASPHGAGAAALYIVEKGVPRDGSRWSTVRSGLQSDGWSVPQSDRCGFTGGKSGERLLMLAPCDSA